MRNLEKIFKACGFQNVDVKLANDLDKILDWQQKLKKIDIANIKPMFTTIGDDVDYIFTDDCAVSEGLDIFLNAPQSDDDFFLVPKVIKN